MDHSDKKEELQEPSTNPSNPKGWSKEWSSNTPITSRPLITFNKKYSNSRVPPPVAPAVAPMVAPIIPADNNKPELKRYYYPRTFSADKFEARIRFAGTQMEGPAANWFSAILKDKKNNAYDQ
ncbi:hypothetical protein MKX08_009571 [Trichoderma sp. CBMAI-0020]|nr:hypothetical protein MKX08_009571 [Trichoderma sp. CBMAI-0020]